ncbi:asparagine synthase (glutamine-hydrolyzing) [uncultured Sulfitobacter sp.]|jgi:asparagine synthase (glutamine-hydrolysing)|uniref:asparagine synthase (glutamine-hydrolyzing) n=1 Tax=uncultured Sulfitobacter sp. TaxID=191468 RepID=UPI0030FD135E
MCGIFGNFCFDPGNLTEAALLDIACAIRHRGPDAVGVAVDARAALGNTRLSILDLSAASNQPMYSDDGNIVLVQNGEIYNFIELREELRRAGHRFDTTGDTEVLLRAFEAWGPNFVTRLNGMFAIAVQDRLAETVWLFRDRLGVKPLYYHGTPETGQLWFGSEIKVLLAAGVPAQPDMDALAQYLALNYIPQPATAFEDIRHLPPAHMAEITPAGMTLTPYWDLVDVTPDPSMVQADAEKELYDLLNDATRVRMRSDAKFGAFLSGGLDSSSVVGLMSACQDTPVRTFSIGFDDPRFDETRFARMAADRFGTDHQVQIMQADTVSLWPRFIWHVDQPHGDVSFMPMDQVSALATQDVKMVLTGDGGDELFAGYDKYADFFPSGGTGHLGANWEDDFVRRAGLLQEDEPATLLTGNLHAAFHDVDPYRALSRQIQRAGHQDPINRVLYAETTTLLPGNNLVKPDRMAMANSLEVRSPFLDYRMAEFAFRMPGHLKLTGGETKAIYKSAVRDLLGDELTYRKKQMFTVPVGEWFRQVLAHYCREILLDGRLGARGIVSEQTVTGMLQAHIAGEANYTRQLRALISLEIWFRLFIDRDPQMLALAQAAPNRGDAP